MQFDRVADEARRQNGWKVVGITESETREGEYPGGVIIFDRPEIAVTSGMDDISYGTAEFCIGDKGRISFHLGHYDMDREFALGDFGDRIKKGR